MDWNGEMDYGIQQRHYVPCVLAFFVPFQLHQTSEESPVKATSYEHISGSLLNMHMTFDPYNL